MYIRSLLTLVSLLHVLPAAGAARRSRHKLIEPQRWKSSSDLTFAEPALTVPLRRGKAKSPSQKYLQTIVGPTTNQTSVFADAFESSYTTDITFGDETFTAIIDTGSSDTWVIQNNFSCIDPFTDATLDPSECGFGPTYMPGGTFRQVPDQYFMTVYGDGEMLTGILGYETVTIAGITVPQQQIALINTAYYYGDGISSGLIGLAYPNLTSAYPGSAPSEDDLGIENSIQYSPIFTSMYEKAGIEPVFSLALNRDNNTGGVLAFGGLPTGVSYNNDFTVAPIKLMQFTQQTPNGTATSFIYTYYAIAVDGIDFVVPDTPVSSATSAVPVSSLSQANGQPPVSVIGSAVYPSEDTMSTFQTSFTSQGEEPGTTACSARPGTSDGASTTNSEDLVDSATSTGALVAASTYQPPGTWWRSRTKRQTDSNTAETRQERPRVYIVDSGTTLIYAPGELARAINDAFDPPGYYDTYTGEYFVDCDAIAPQVTIRINGTRFDINPADLILNNVTPIEGAEVDPDFPTPCGSGIAAAGEDDDFFVLGSVFLRNVVAVFDVGAGEMRFAATD